MYNTYLPSVTVQSADVFTQKQMLSEPDMASDEKKAEALCAQMFASDQDENQFLSAGTLGLYPQQFRRSLRYPIPLEPSGAPLFLSSLAFVWTNL